MISRIILYIFFLIYFSSCTYIGSCSNDNSLSNPLIYNLNEIIDFENVTADDIEESTNFSINDASIILEEILLVPDKERTFNNTLLRIDDL